MKRLRGLQAGPFLLASFVLCLFAVERSWAQSPLARQIAAGGQSVPQSQPLGTDGIRRDFNFGFAFGADDVVHGSLFRSNGGLGFRLVSDFVRIEEE